MIVLLLLILAFCFASVDDSLTKAIRWPSEEAIHRIFADMQLDNFAHRTGLPAQLGGGSYAVLGIALSYELAVHDYQHKHHMPMISCIGVQMQKGEFIKRMLDAVGRPELFQVGVDQKFWESE